MAEENKEKDREKEQSSAIDDAEKAAEKAAEETTEKAAEETADKDAEETAGEPAENEAQDADQPLEAEEDSGSKEAREDKKKDKKDALIEELQDRVKRQMAEFDNFRKRSEKEKAGMFEMGAKSVIEQILPIVDNFERGLGAIGEEQKSDPFVEGMDRVYRQMTEALEKLGVKPIEAVGCEFNPDLHNAVMHVEDPESPDNTIVEEFQKGYKYREQVVRHSMVKVAN